MLETNNSENDQVFASDTRLQAGDVLHLHRDVLAVPAARYVFEGFWGNLVTLRLGDCKVVLDRRCLSFCTVEQGHLSKEEIFTTQVRMKELVELTSVQAEGLSLLCDKSSCFQET